MTLSVRSWIRTGCGRFTLLNLSCEGWPLSSQLSLFQSDGAFKLLLGLFTRLSYGPFADFLHSTESLDEYHPKI